MALFRPFDLSKRIAAIPLMPFTANAFLEVFAAYNQALWPLAAVLWLVTVMVFAPFVAGGAIRTPLPRMLIAGHWLWAALMYHAFFFTAINPAAWLFAALFVIQAALFVAAKPSDGTTSARPGSARHAAASALIVYSLIYPVIAWADGFTYPSAPTFGVPCPTVILTIGFLIAVPTRSFLLSVIPVAWSIIGGTAAWLFGVHADFALPAAGALLAADLILKRSHVMRKPSFVSGVILLVAMLVLVPASSVLAQATQHDHEQQAQKSGMKMGEMKMDAKMMDEMAAKKKANTARITALMAQVKGSTGDAKVAAMADVIGVLLEERAAMGEHCASMMSMMKK